jgi:hypothetical protein
MQREHPQPTRTGTLLDPNEHLLDTDQAAPIVGCSTKKLANDRSAHKGPPYIKIGSLVRYRLADLQQFILSHRVDPTEGRAA